MPTEVIMPKVDMDMASGTIMAWHVEAGQTVAAGDPLFDIETDKAAMEVEAPGAGILHHLAPEGTKIAIGEPVAYLYAEGEEVGDPPASLPDPVEQLSEAPQDEAPQQDVAAPEPAHAEAAPAGRDLRATPRARGLARDGGINLAAVQGSGPRGRIQAGDVAALLKTPAAPVQGGALSITRSKGGTGTPVILLHGFASDAASWAPLEPALKHRPLIRIDLPGHGRSPNLPVADFAALAAFVRRAFTELDLARAHLIGHSLGGALALALADTRPRNVESLTLIAPAGLGPEVDGATLNGITRASRVESLAPWLRRLVRDERIVTEGYARAVMMTRTDPGLRLAQAELAEVLFPDGVQAFDLRAALARVAAPTRVIWGKRDRIIPWRHALEAKGAVALHLFDDVGHLPQIEAAEEIGKLLAPHL
ncbi:MAG: acetoin dehydrogenase dihydrolipoyllysine-residue acetyltransferase subunit [Pseudomonadota bacterium]